MNSLDTWIDEQHRDIMRNVPKGPNPHDLIVEHFKLEDWLEAESKRFAEHIKPVKARMEAIKQTLLAMAIEQKVDGFPTEAGTAYKSTIMNPSIESRETYLDFVLDNWEACGNEMLQLRAPNVDSVRNYMQDHDGDLPPGVKTANLVRMNIRRS
jgi:hypothetical protein